mgnify:CR=1 FL=1
MIERVPRMASLVNEATYLFYSNYIACVLCQSLSRRCQRRLFPPLSRQLELST